MPLAAKVPGRPPSTALANPLLVFVALAFAITLAIASCAHPREAMAQGLDARPAPKGLEGVAARTDSLYQEALHDSIDAVLRPLVSDARRRGDRVALLWLLRRQGELRVQSGRAKDGLPLVLEAIQLARAARDTATWTNALRAQDYALQQLGRYDEARRVAQQMLDLATLRGDRYHIARAHISFGWFAHRDGHPEESRRHYAEASRIARELDRPPELALCLLGEAQAALALGDWVEARRLDREALALARTHGLRRYVAHAAGYLAELDMVEDDYASAARGYREAYVTYRELGNAYQAIYPGTDLALSLSLLGHHEEAVALIDTLYRLTVEQGYSDVAPLTLGVLGRIRLEQGRANAAREAYRRAFALRTNSTPAVRAHVLTGLMHCLRLADSARVALAIHAFEEPRLRPALDPFFALNLEVEEGDCLLATGRAKEAANSQGQTARAAESRALWRVAESAWLSGARAARVAGDSARASQWLEQAARAWERARAIPGEAVWRERAAPQGHEIVEEMLDLLLPPAGRTVDDGTSRQAFDLLERFRARTLLERMSGPLALAGQPQTSTSASALTTRELDPWLLRSRETILSCFLGERHAFSIVLSQKGCRAARLDRNALATEASLLADAASRSGNDPARVDELSRAAARVKSLLWGPLATELAGAGRVFLVPDGVLHRLPLALLSAATDSVQGGGGGGGGGRAQSALELDFVPSASVLVRVRERSVRSDPGQWGERGILVIRGRDEPAGARASLAEVNWLARSFRPVHVRNDGDPDLTIERLGEGPVLHVAGHSLGQDTAPWQSELPFRLAPDTSAVRASDIATQSVPAQLVVLASCESAGGAAVSGEGVAGLSTAFLSAGAQSVVATLWPVEDRATARFMQRFYDALSRGEGVGRALLAAQTETRRHRETAHPFYWAGFVVVGDGGVRVPIERASAHGTRIALLAGGAIAALLLIGWAVKQRAARRKEEALQRTG